MLALEFKESKLTKINYKREAMHGFRLSVVVVYYFGRPAVTKPTTPRDRQLGSHRIVRAISLYAGQMS